MATTANGPVDAPDLVVMGITPTHVLLGDTVGFVVTVRNRGRTAAGAFDVEFALTPGGERVAWPLQSAPGLAAGAMVTFTFSCEVTSPMDIPIETTVDVGNRVMEADEGNNVLHVVVTVGTAG